jgi:Tfp pilus assembly protein PilP
LAYDPEPLGAVARHEKLELEGGVHFMQLIRTVVVKQILTEQSKQKLLDKYFAGKLQMQKEYEQLQFELKKLEKAKKYQSSALKSHFEKELQKRHDKEKLYEFQIEQLHMLPLGSELKQKEVQALVEVKVGDNWDEVMDQTIITIKDGIIEEIR